MKGFPVSGQHDFRPCLLARNPHVQSLLAGSGWRVRGKRPALEKSEEVIVTTSDGSRLLAFFLHHPEPRGLILLMHGWEGSVSSPYMIDAAAFFHRIGYSICRLNLRDHGDSHHLNEGLFHGALLEETFEAVDFLAGLSGGKPAHLIGFSLGGNYALRIARRYSDMGQGRLNRVFAVSPPLDPYKTTLAIDAGYSAYRDYFLKKWKGSLMKKQRLFPERYDFGKMLHSRTCMELTEKIMCYYPEFPTYRDYFDRYTLKDDFFRGLKVPVTIFIARDDPVIPKEDFESLSGHENFRLFLLKYGGHCGFMDLFPLRCWYNGVIAASLEAGTRT